MAHDSDHGDAVLPDDEPTGTPFDLPNEFTPMVQRIAILDGHLAQRRDVVRHVPNPVAPGLVLAGS